MAHRKSPKAVSISKSSSKVVTYSKQNLAPFAFSLMAEIGWNPLQIQYTIAGAIPDMIIYKNT